MSKPDKKLFLLDAYALIYRAHFAFSKNPRISSKGINTGVMLGFTNTLLEILYKEQPSHIAVAFDTSKPTFRHEQYAEYKANRQETPEDIKVGVPVVKDIIRAFNIPIIELDGFEADDIIGTIAKKAARSGFEVFMMTPDKDFGQLVEEHIYLYKPSYMGNAVDVMGIPEVLAKWDIERIDQVIDMLGLQGDASDNIPGIPGIGVKTASKLLKAYGSVEGLIENIDQLKGKQRENVENFAQQGLMSKELATINIEVPVPFDEVALEYSGPNEEMLRPIFEELEFKTILKRVFGEEMKKGAQPALSDNQLSMFSQASINAIEVQKDEDPKNTFDKEKVNYQFVIEQKAIDKLVAILLKQKEFCFDTETTGIDAFEAEVVGISFSFKTGDAYYIPLPEDQKKAKEIVQAFAAPLTSDKIVKIGQNIKYDILVLKKYDLHVQGPIFDTMLAHYLIEPEIKHSMDAIAEQYLNYTPISITEILGPKGKNQKNMRDIDPKEVVNYACEDADITFQLKQVLVKELDERLLKLLNEVEHPLVYVLAQMEFEGVKIDQGALETMSKELQVISLEAQDEIFKIAGQEFNIASPKQLGEILFDKLRLVDKPKKTKTGQYATGEEILSRLANEHDIANKILEFREYQKLKSTYVDALPRMISPRDGRVHTDYGQAVAATGRLSSNNPNLQNIPIRTKKGREIRRAFVPKDDNHVLLAADYSQIELRIAAAFAEDKDMIDAFKNGRDIHSTTAAKVFDVALEEVDATMRRKAKEVNFGIIYGISAFGLSQNLNIPRGEASDIIKAYFKEFSSIKAYMDTCIAQAKEDEYVETIMGRRRYLRDINSKNATMRGFSERNAVNAPIQGSAADIIKIAMVQVHDWLKKENLKTTMIMQVHDELVFEVPKDELEKVKEKVVELMKNAVKLDVPMEVEAGVGENWLVAH